MSVPATAVYNGGIATTPDGAVYVQHTDGATQANPTFTGVVKAADGTAGAPSYSFTSDPLTGTYYSSASYNITVNGTRQIAVTENLVSLLPNSSNGSVRICNAASLDFSSSGSAGDTFVTRAAANSLRFGGSAATTTSRTEINKAVTAFSNAVAKSVFTVTVPNAQHHAVIELEVQGALGAGGAIGAGEAMATNTYKIAIVRTPGVATVATASAATHAVAVAVAGAATVTATAAVSAMTGAVGATQTFEINVTISRSGGASDNHTALCYAKLVNANATGITIA